jgi:hypothetical protein
MEFKISDHQVSLRDRVIKGLSKDKAQLIQFMNLMYQELFPDQRDFNHLSMTVEQYFSTETPLWWIESSGRGSLFMFGERQAPQDAGKSVSVLVQLRV